MEALAADIRLLYEQKDITNELEDYLTNITYTDNLSGQSDELSIALMNDGRWYHDWYPGHGDVLTFEWGWNNEKRRTIGRFEIDEVEFNISPNTVTIRALSAGLKASVRTTVNIAYENLTLDKIIKQVADRQGFTLSGTIYPISIDRITQQESDLEFLTKLADEYDYAFKIDDNVLVFYAISELEKQQPVEVISIADILSGSFRDQIKQLPKNAQVKYHNPATKETVIYDVKNEKITTKESSVTQTATSNDTKQSSSRSTSPEVASAKAQAEINKANREKIIGDVQLIGKPNYLSGNVIVLKDIGDLSGQYLITAGTHQISKNGGSQSNITLKKIISGE